MLVLLRAETRVGREGQQSGTAPSLLAACTRLQLSDQGRKEGLEETMEGRRARRTCHLERQLFWAPSCRVEQGVPRAMEEKVLEGREGRKRRAEASRGWEADAGDGRVTSICPLLPGVLVQPPAKPCRAERTRGHRAQSPSIPTGSESRVRPLHMCSQREGVPTPPSASSGRTFTL